MVKLYYCLCTLVHGNWSSIGLVILFLENFPYTFPQTGSTEL